MVLILISTQLISLYDHMTNLTAHDDITYEYSVLNYDITIRLALN